VDEFLYSGWRGEDFGWGEVFVHESFGEVVRNIVYKFEHESKPSNFSNLFLDLNHLCLL
jgi:hypothetical protein